MIVLWIIAAYLLGTFPSAQLVARANGVDITAVGSGNPGASNVARALGWRKGVWVFVLDAAKGALATAVGLLVFGRAGGFLLGAAAIVGHVFPATRGFRGGKGVATGGGVLAVLHPLIAVVAAPVWLLVTRITHKPVVGSIAAIALVPIGLAVAGAEAWEYWATGFVLLVIVIRHAGNVKRLIRREEHSLRPG